MVRLYTLWELEKELSPDKFQNILSPDAALEKAAFIYDLDYRNYTSPPVNDAPARLPVPKDKPYIRSGHDPVYDALETNLMEGWIIGVGTDEYWDDTVNPFHINAAGELVFDGIDPFCWVVSEFLRAFQLAIINRNGRKPTATEKFRPSGGPVQHAQAAKTINSKAAGRLLAAGEIYNGNIEGFHETAQLLGGDAPAGYDQVMDNKGLIIAGASFAAGLGLGRLRPINEITELKNLHVLGKVEGEYSILNPGPLSNDLAETFSSGAYKEITLSADTTFYRGGVEGRPLGQFFGYEQPQGVLQTRVDKALLPQWPNGSVSPLNAYHEIQIPAGTKVYVGEVGYQTDIYSGGTEQVVVPTPWKIPGVNFLSNGILK